MEVYTLKAAYLRRLSVVRSLEKEDLTRPGILEVVSSFLGHTDAGGEYLKLTSGQFVHPETGEPLPANPLEWPNGRATEVGIGPWRAADPSLWSERFERFARTCWREPIRNLSPKNQRMYDIWNACGSLGGDCDFPKGPELIEGEERSEGAYVNFEKMNWKATLDPEGVNREGLAIMDRAEWAVRREIRSGLAPRIELIRSFEQDPHAFYAYWRFKGAEVRLCWNLARLVDGFLTRFDCSEDVSPWVLHDTLGESLGWLCLKIGLTPQELMNTAAGGIGVFDRKRARRRVRIEHEFQNWLDGMVVMPNPLLEVRLGDRLEDLPPFVGAGAPGAREAGARGRRAA